MRSQCKKFDITIESRVSLPRYLHQVTTQSYRCLQAGECCLFAATGGTVVLWSCGPVVQLSCSPDYPGHFLQVRCTMPGLYTVSKLSTHLTIPATTHTLYTRAGQQRKKTFVLITCMHNAYATRIFANKLKT